MDYKDCEGILRRRVKLGYVPDSPTSVQLVDSVGNQVFDMLPVIQAGETDTSIELLNDTRRIRYYPEKWTRTDGREGCFYDICIPDIEALMLINEIGNVENKNPLEDGDILMYNADNQRYEMYNLTAALGDIETLITNTNNRIATLENRVSVVENAITQLQHSINELIESVGGSSVKIQDIENAIYNWANDKTTKIPRGTINITSGGYNSNYIIQSRAKNQDQDLNFE